jgi:hypothetical protein
MRHIIQFMSLIFFLSTNVKSQTFYVYDDSVGFSVQPILTEKDSVENFRIKITNSSASNIFISKIERRNSYAYLNNKDGILMVACNSHSGSNQDYSRQSGIAIQKIDKYDSLVFAVPAILTADRHLTRMEFWKMGKTLTIDYVLSATAMPFTKKENYYKEFMMYKKTLTSVVPGNRL